MSGLKLYNSLDDCKKLQSKHKLASYEYLDLDPIDERMEIQSNFPRDDFLFFLIWVQF